MYASPDFRVFRQPWEDTINIETVEAISEKSFFLREAAGLKDFRFQRGLAPIAVLYWLVSFKVHLWQKAEETSSVYHFLSSLILCIFKKGCQNIFTTFRSMTARKWQIFQNSVGKNYERGKKIQEFQMEKKYIFPIWDCKLRNNRRRKRQTQTYKTAKASSRSKTSIFVKSTDFFCNNKNRPIGKLTNWSHATVVRDWLWLLTQGYDKKSELYPMYFGTMTLVVQFSAGLTNYSNMAINK